MSDHSHAHQSSSNTEDGMTSSTTSSTSTSSYSSAPHHHPLPMHHVPSTSATKEGWMYKSAGRYVRAPFDRRWFTLTPTELKFLKKDGSTKTIPLDVIGFVLADSNHPKKKLYADKHPFDIITDDRRWTFFGESARDTEDWRYGLQRALDARKSCRQQVDLVFLFHFGVHPIHQQFREIQLAIDCGIAALRAGEANADVRVGGVWYSGMRGHGTNGHSSSSSSSGSRSTLCKKALSLSEDTVMFQQWLQGLQDPPLFNNNNNNNNNNINNSTIGATSRSHLETKPLWESISFARNNLHWSLASAHKVCVAIVDVPGLNIVNAVEIGHLREEIVNMSHHVGVNTIIIVRNADGSFSNLDIMKGEADVQSSLQQLVLKAVKTITKATSSSSSTSNTPRKYDLEASAEHKCDCCSIIADTSL